MTKEERHQILKDVYEGKLRHRKAEAFLELDGYADLLVELCHAGFGVPQVSSGEENRRRASELLQPLLRIIH